MLAKFHWLFSKCPIWPVWLYSNLNSRIEQITYKVLILKLNSKGCIKRTIIVLGTFYLLLSKKHRSVIVTGEPQLPALLFNINLLVQSKDTKMARSQNDASRSYHWIPTIFATISPILSRFKSEERSPKKPELTWVIYFQKSDSGLEQDAGVPNENVVQNHLNIELLNVF